MTKYSGLCRDACQIMEYFVDWNKRDGMKKNEKNKFIIHWIIAMYSGKFAIPSGDGICIRYRPQRGKEPNHLFVRCKQVDGTGKPVAGRGGLRMHGCGFCTGKL